MTDWSTLAAIAVGGALGALSRFGLGHAFPRPPGGFPVTTLVINVVGCLLIAVLTVLITETRQAGPLVRPFLSAGFLGGFTTFSTYAVDILQVIDEGHPRIALAYLLLTPLLALLAVLAGLRLTRQATRGRP
ncbi:MAG: fluoride efflux transporter CrcB [Streptosporangiaceae bacterium]